MRRRGAAGARRTRRDDGKPCLALRPLRVRCSRRPIRKIFTQRKKVSYILQKIYVLHKKCVFYKKYIYIINCGFVFVVCSLRTIFGKRKSAHVHLASWKHGNEEVRLNMACTQ